MVTFDHQNITTISLNCVPETSVVFCKTCNVSLLVFSYLFSVCSECAVKVMNVLLNVCLKKKNFVRLFVCVSQEVLHVYWFTVGLVGPTLK